MRPALLVLGVYLAGACSSTPRPLEIVYVDAPATVTADSNGTYPLYVVVQYSGGDSPPAALLYSYPSLNIDGDYPVIRTPPIGSGNLGFPLSLPGDAMKGSFEYVLSLRTQSGLQSNQATENVVAYDLPPVSIAVRS